MHKFLTFSFDDGTVQDERLIALFDQYGLKGTFNLNSGRFGVCRRIVHEGIEVDHNVISESRVRTLYQGHEIAAHTVNHPNLVRQTPEVVIREVDEDCKALEALSGQKIFGMAYPGAGLYYTEEVAELIRKNTQIRYARGCKNHHSFVMPQNLMLWEPTCHQNDSELMALAEQFIQAEAGQEDLLFYVWGHSFEFDKFQSWTAFERFCEKIAGHKDIEYVTNGEVARYISGQS